MKPAYTHGECTSKPNLNQRKKVNPRLFSGDLKVLPCGAASAKGFANLA
jgi:hypothetical protein